MPYFTGCGAHSNLILSFISINDRPEGRDAFLSNEVVEIGQKIHQRIQLEKCVTLAMCSAEYGVNGRHEVDIALLLCSKEIEDLGIPFTQ